MLITVEIYYTDRPYTPRVFAATFEDAWQLWFTLTKAMVAGESGPHVIKVKLYHNRLELDPSKGKILTYV